MSNILKYQNSSSPLLIQQVNQSGANFVKRLLDPNRKSIPDWETKGAKIATHKLGWAEDDQGAYVYPEVQEINGQLIDFSRPPYAPGIADYLAHKNNNIVRMSPEEADWFTKNYKQYYPSFKKGGNIHIKKKNRGKFTEYCGGKVTEECIDKGKKSSDSKIRKRATFAANARKWKHENGGILKYQNPAEPLPQVLKTVATFPDWLRGTWSYLSGNKDSKLLESQYRPTKETNPNTKYYYRDGLNTDVIKNILGGTDYGKKTRFGEHLYYKDFNDVWNRLSAAGGRAERNTDNSHLGAYTIGIGEDDKGRYISYYDKFDWAPPGLPEIFHPYEIYNRIYEDEFNNTQSNLKNITYSGYNPSGNWFFKSGREQYNNINDK